MNGSSFGSHCFTIADLLSVRPRHGHGIFGSVFAASHCLVRKNDKTHRSPCRFLSWSRKTKYEQVRVPIDAPHQLSVNGRQDTY